jgi:hypothetical protein
MWSTDGGCVMSMTITHTDVFRANIGTSDVNCSCPAVSHNSSSMSWWPYLICDLKCDALIVGVSFDSKEPCTWRIETDGLPMPPSPWRILLNVLVS